MIVISLDLALTLTDEQANAPLLLYKNFLTISNIATTTSAVDYPASNLANPSTFLEWRGTTAAANETITATLGVATDLDCIAIARHNLGSTGATFTVEARLPGGAYVQVAGPIAPGDDKPLIARFVKAGYDAVRVIIDPGSSAPRIAVLYVGLALAGQRKIYVGHTPLPYGRETMVATGRSMNGNFLGRVVLRETTRTQIQFQNLTPSWYRSFFDPFVISAKEQPFFWAWRPSKYPLEVGYCWTISDPVPSNMLPNGMMQVSFEVEGIVE